MKTDPAAAMSISAVPAKAGVEAWWTLSVLFLLYVLSFLDRHIITMLVPDIKADLGLTDFSISILLGPAFAIFYALFGLPLGWASDRYPRRWVIFLGTAFWAVATAASGLAQSFTTLLLARIGVGAGEAALAPSAYSLLADKFPPNRLTTALSVYHTGIKVGSAAAFAIGGVAIAAANNIGPVTLPLVGVLQPWHLVFFLVGAPGILVALLVFTFSEPPRRAPAKDARGFGELKTFLKANGRLIALLLAGVSLMAVCAYSLTSWTPAFLQRRYGLEAIEYGPALSVVSLVSAVVLVLKGGVIDILFGRGMKDAHIRFYTWLLALSVPFAAFAFFSPTPIIFYLFYGVVQAVAIPFMAYVSTLIQLMTPKALRGQMTSLFLFTFTILGLGTGPMIVGALTDFVFRDEQMIGASLALLLCVSIPAAFVAFRFSLPGIREAVVAQQKSNS